MCQTNKRFIKHILVLYYCVIDEEKSIPLFSIQNCC